MPTIADENFILNSIQQMNPTAVSKVEVASFIFRPEFLAYCQANQCGHYNKCWTCPPNIGEVQTLIDEVKVFCKAIVYQFVGQLKHSFDYKSILAAGKCFHKITSQILDEIVPKLPKYLILGSGPCRLCDKCGCLENKPCRYPDKAIRSLEANCIDVAALATSANLKYINGQNTVTLFGAILFD